MRLSILCITRAEACVLPLLDAMGSLAETVGAEWVLAADGEPAAAALVPFSARARIVPVQSAHYLESVYNGAVAACWGDYVLRLDDDESVSPAVPPWLRDGGFLAHPHWYFSRAHLWTDHDHYLRNVPLWPDQQTRLSRRSLSDRPAVVHSASPYGRGEMAPGYLLHHKFLIRTQADRQAIADRYESIQPGAGRGKFLAGSVPEAAFASLDIGPLTEVRA